MNDPRTTPCNGRVAASWLKGRVTAERFIEGSKMRVSEPFVDLLRGENGPRDRQLLRGDGVVVFETRNGYCFVQSEKDGHHNVNLLMKIYLANFFYTVFRCLHSYCSVLL